MTIESKIGASNLFGMLLHGAHSFIDLEAGVVLESVVQVHVHDLVLLLLVLLLNRELVPLHSIAELDKGVVEGGDCLGED